MRKLISFMHISLDGFVAGPGGEMDWITVNDEIFEHVEKRVARGDAALYGKTTYQMMEAYWPEAGRQPNASRHDVTHSLWYNSIHKFVLSNSIKEEKSDRTVVSGNLAEKLMQIKKLPGKGEEILIFGSPGATHSLMELNLVDGYWLFVNPVILGKGIALFNGVRTKQRLKLEHTQQFSCGVVEVSYSNE